MLIDSPGLPCIALVFFRWISAGRLFRRRGRFTQGLISCRVPFYWCSEIKKPELITCTTFIDLCLRLFHIFELNNHNTHSFPDVLGGSDVASTVTLDGTRRARLAWGRGCLLKKMFGKCRRVKQSQFEEDLIKRYKKVLGKIDFPSTPTTFAVIVKNNPSWNYC